MTVAIETGEILSSHRIEPIAAPGATNDETRGHRLAVTPTIGTWQARR
jgi:hypothetical protein